MKKAYLKPDAEYIKFMSANAIALDGNIDLDTSNVDGSDAILEDD